MPHIGHKHLFATVLLGTLALVALSCTGIVRGKVDIAKIAPVDTAARSFVLLTQTRYLADLAAALGQHGFRLKPLVRRGEGDIALTDGGRGLAVYEDARYGIQIDQTFDQSCAFTPSSIYAFTITIVDIKNNEIAMVLRQTGADGPCTTVKPVWPTLAEAIARNWQ